MDRLLDRFFFYVSFDTQSKASSRHVPSTEGQMKLAHALQDELQEMGLTDIHLDEHGCLMATLPANVDWKVPTIGFIAHLDTSPDFSGKNVNPQIVDNYRGGDIALGIGDEILSPVMFPVLHELHGKTLITTDGKTLLGADDKAGIAEIMTAIMRLKESNIPHGDIRVGFIPDEEIGRGAQYFDVKRFAADWAYTIDGGAVGELEYENFNAASAVIHIQGNNVHPGSAKDVMVNALTLAAQFHASMPVEETPEHTEGYEGFFHLNQFKGTVEKAELHYIIRDFDSDCFAARKRLLQDKVDSLNTGMRNGCHATISFSDAYRNMRDKVLKHPHIIDIARQAMQECGVTVCEKPIRGGTDGAQLSYRGLPCPNIFTGGYNFHSKHEFVTVEGMESAVDVIARIAALTAERARNA
ncbi:peptidase T [Plesiomonas shigelloides]|uniref:peptidase T n=1 Tax=Plesiomonas shigelloides TaxID=703 RepID=UPI0030C437DC